MAKQCIGIDIGHHAIKLVQLKIGRRGEHSLQNFGIEPLPEGAIVDGTVMDHTAVAGALRELKDRIRLKGAEAAFPRPEPEPTARAARPLPAPASSLAAG